MTTISTASAIPFRANRFLHWLLIVFVAWMLYLAIDPERVFDFWLENLTTVAFLAVLAATYRRLCLSELSYLLIFVYLCLHEWGAHYKYSDVPLGEWMKPLLATQRNHYDRVMHFSYGLLLAYPMQEWFTRSAGARGFFRYLLPLQFTLACSAVYEMLEALMANILSPTRGEEFVGMQGDIWDSQKDMAMAALGAMVALAGIAWLRARTVQPAAAAREIETQLAGK